MRIADSAHRELAADYSAPGRHIECGCNNFYVSKFARALEVGFAISHCGGLENTQFSTVASKLGNPLAIEEYGLVIKRYPSCGYTHRIVDAVIQICQQEHIAPQDVKAITATIPHHFLNALRYGVPKDEREALFSLPYCMSAALHDRALTFDHFTSSAIAVSAVIDFIRHIHIETYVARDPNANMGPSAPDTVKIELKNGQLFQETIDYPVGMPPKSISQADLHKKFKACSRRVLSKQKTSHVIELIEHFETLSSVRDLTALFDLKSKSAS